MFHSTECLRRLLCFVFLLSYSTVLIDFDCQSAQLGTFVILVCYSVLSDVGPAVNSSFYTWEWKEKFELYFGKLLNKNTNIQVESTAPRTSSSNDCLPRIISFAHWNIRSRHSEEVSKKSASERGKYNMPTYWETNRIKIQLKKYSNYLLKFQVPDLDFYYLTCNININKN